MRLDENAAGFEANKELTVKEKTIDKGMKRAGKKMLDERGQRNRKDDREDFEGKAGHAAVRFAQRQTMQPYTCVPNRSHPPSPVCAPLRFECLTLVVFPPPLPFHSPLHIHDIPQFPTQLYHPAPHHAWIDRYRLLDQFLGGRRGVEAHNEVMSAVMFGLVLLDGLGEKEGAPIGDTTDHAALGEDKGSGCASDSGTDCVSPRDLKGVQGSRKRKELLGWERGKNYSLTSFVL